MVAVSPAKPTALVPLYTPISTPLRSGAGGDFGVCVGLGVGLTVPDGCPEGRATPPLDGKALPITTTPPATRATMIANLKVLVATER